MKIIIDIFITYKRMILFTGLKKYEIYNYYKFK